jgi:hypothetical protein
LAGLGSGNGFEAGAAAQTATHRQHDKIVMIAGHMVMTLRPILILALFMDSS